MMRPFSIFVRFVCLILIFDFQVEKMRKHRWKGRIVFLTSTLASNFAEDSGIMGFKGRLIFKDEEDTLFLLLFHLSF